MELTNVSGGRNMYRRKLAFFVERIWSSVTGITKLTHSGLNLLVLPGATSPNITSSKHVLFRKSGLASQTRFPSLFRTRNTTGSIWRKEKASKAFHKISYSQWNYTFLILVAEVLLDRLCSFLLFFTVITSLHKWYWVPEIEENKHHILLTWVFAHETLNGKTLANLGWAHCISFTLPPLGLEIKAEHLVVSGADLLSDLQRVSCHQGKIAYFISGYFPSFHVAHPAEIFLNAETSDHL